MMVTYDLASEGGGVKQHALHLAAALRRLGDEVTLVGPSSKPVDDPQIKTFGGVVNVPANGSDNMLGIFVQPWKVWWFFRKNHFDVIHVHEPLQPSMSYYAVWSTPRTPHVATFHAYAEQEGKILRWARRVFGYLIFPFFRRGIAVSAPAVRYAADAWHRPLTIIPNGVPTRIFHAAPALAGARAAEKPASGAPVKLLFVGRLGDRRKGIRYLIEAYERLIARGVPVTLDVVGELGGAEPPPKLPGLTYHGVLGQADLAARYRACDVFVAPSTGQESFGIVLLEAMSSQKPIICSDIDGYRQVALPEGARLVPPADSAALERTIAEVVALAPEERRRMGLENQRHAAGFEWDALAGRVRAEYLTAMGVPQETAEAELSVRATSEAEPEPATTAATGDEATAQASSR